MAKSFVVVVVVVLEIFILKTTFQIRKKPSLGGRPIIPHLIYTNKKIIIQREKIRLQKKKMSVVGILLNAFQEQQVFIFEEIEI